MNRVELKEGIYAVGAVDWNVRNFHGYTTNRGATYNAYLIIDEKITLIDTVKASFAGELIGRISEIIDPSKIDYVISNHVEMDHSGAIPAVMDLAKNAVLVTSEPNGIKGLKAHYGEDYEFKSVKAGDSLCLGKRNLTFVSTPMLHWPDNMVTYCPEEKILFSNDAFGQHFASSKRFDDEVNFNTIIEEAQKYYANILMPYGVQTQKALEIVRNMDIDIIAPSHGIIWRSHVAEIMDKYHYFSNGITEEKAVIVYDSMWHSTEKMALAILEGFEKKGIETQLYDLKENHISDIMTVVLKSKYIAVGSPTLNNNMLPTVAGFLTYFRGLMPRAAGKQTYKGIAFGSYGWGGQSVKQVYDELEKMQLEMVLEPIKIAYVPTKQKLEEIEDLICEMK